MSFTAQYFGRCAVCDEPIRPGQEAKWSEDDTIMHVACPEPALTLVDLRPRERVCRSCHLVHPGEC